MEVSTGRGRHATDTSSRTLLLKVYVAAILELFYAPATSRRLLHDLIKVVHHVLFHLLRHTVSAFATAVPLDHGLERDVRLTISRLCLDVARVTLRIVFRQLCSLDVLRSLLLHHSRHRKEVAAQAIGRAVTSTVGIGATKQL